MTGSLQTKNGKYYIVLNLTENGKRKQKWIATGLEIRGNKRSAEKLLREKLTEYESSPQLVRSDTRFSDCIRQWLEDVRRRVDEVTFQGYQLSAKTQVIPYFDASGVKLDRVTRELLQAYFDEKAAHGRKDGKGGLSPASLRQHKNIINQTLKEAVKNHLIPSNPCEFVELPKMQHFEASFYTAEQLKRLFRAVESDPLGPLVKITALYGLRRSEVLGLQWDSIDFDAGRVTVKHTVSKVTKAVEKDKTKNPASRRSFPLTEEARQIFRAAKQDEEENRRMFGKAYSENAYVFKWPDGTPFSPDYVTDHFSLLLKRHGLPHIRFHELRHSCASLLLNQGFTLKDVQEYMGHADIKMTANIYGHLDTARKQTLTENVSGLLF